MNEIINYVENLDFDGYSNIYIKSDLVMDEDGAGLRGYKFSIGKNVDATYFDFENIFNKIIYNTNINIEDVIQCICRQLINKEGYYYARLNNDGNLYITKTEFDTVMSFKIGDNIKYRTPNETDIDGVVLFTKLDGRETYLFIDGYGLVNSINVRKIENGGKSPFVQVKSNNKDNISLSLDKKFYVDKNNNKWDVDYDIDVVKTMAKSLRDCNECINCENCTNCNNCINCDMCNDCNNCNNCFDSSRCNDCKNCQQCTECDDCANCVKSDNCDDCKNCTNCNNCDDCTNCTNCNNCDDCTNCTNCNNCDDCKNSTGKTNSDGNDVTNNILKMFNIPTMSKGKSNTIVCNNNSVTVNGKKIDCKPGQSISVVNGKVTIK